MSNETPVYAISGGEFSLIGNAPFSKVSGIKNAAPGRNGVEKEGAALTALIHARWQFFVAAIFGGHGCKPPRRVLCAAQRRRDLLSAPSRKVLFSCLSELRNSSP